MAVEPPAPVFGTDGIRGRVGVELTPSLALQLGYSCGHVLNQGRPVLLGRDSRKSSPMFLAALQTGLLAAGREVWDLGLCPTPTVAWLTRHQQAAGGLMISASHNPPADNGIKVFDQDGCKLSLCRQRDLEQWLKRSAPRGCHAGGGSSHQRHDLLKVYEQGLLDQLEPEEGRRLRVVLDLCWGAATACAVGLFERFGAEVTVLHGQPDGNQINVGCGSTALGLLQQAVVEQEADLGIAFDGDADRCLAVDHRGQPVNGDHILYLWGGLLDDCGRLPEHRLVITQMANLGFRRAWMERGGVMEETPVGDQHVHDAMQRTGAALGGEQSGHVLWSQHHSIGDGLMTALQLTQLTAKSGHSLAALAEKSFYPYPQKLTNVRITDQQRREEWRRNSRLRDGIAAAEAVLGQDGRVFIRASGTEPLLRVMVEAREAEMVEDWSQRLSSLATAAVQPS
ncbi:MAG: phosphoglucosamine mutase [Candidatus Synechococcus spongiarum SP3]|uniref:Phosphoglucosamine mutase n=1 Tax=Candidatus Synechococcus spongiarum SP3 TaxID=1604020 RepID=A0A0G2J536_9SYNE|nr:MAG: phosphoglucosamine mutase [Candidatus Synechococcus spongiarum SP3]